MCFESLLDPTAEGKAARRLLQGEWRRPIQGGSGQDFWKIRVDMGPDFTIRDLEEDARIDSDPEGINKALSEGPTLIAWWGRSENIARQLVVEAKSRLELYEAELFRSMPGRIETEGNKPTVDAIRSRIILDETRQALNKDLQTKEHNLGVIIVGRQAMVHKKDCSLSLAANMRAEMDYQLSIGKGRLLRMFNKEGGEG